MSVNGWKKTASRSSRLPYVRVCIYVRPCHESSAWNFIEKNDYEWLVHADRQRPKIKIKGRIMQKRHEEKRTTDKKHINNKLKRCLMERIRVEWREWTESEREQNCPIIKSTCISDVIVLRKKGARFSFCQFGKRITLSARRFFLSPPFL